MTPSTVQLFVTPMAGVRTRAKARALRRALMESGMRVILTPTGLHPLAIDASADHVCAVGGDGTLRYVVQAARQLDRPIGVSVYPAGTVNLVAMELAYPASPAGFARRLASGEARPRHLASVGGLPLLACASVGPDSHAVEAVSPAMKRWLGRAAYILAFLLILARWPRAALVLQHDGQRTACEAVYIAKGPFFAGRWSIAPHASGDEPLLEVVALPTASRRHFLRFAWAIFRHRTSHLTGVHRFSCRELTIADDQGSPLQGDGDVLVRLPATIAIEPRPLPFA